METGDLLLLVALLIAGVIALAYVILVLGARTNRQYVLQCPDSSSKPGPLPPNVTVTPSGAVTGNANPSVPGVTVSATSYPTLIPDPVASTPLAPTPVPLTASTVTVFRNRSTGYFLSVCDGCLPSATAVMAQTSDYLSTVAQWVPSSSTTSWQLTNKRTPSPLAVNLQGQAILQPDASTTITFVPVDANGYRMMIGPQALQVCCDPYTRNCGCSGYLSNGSYGVSAVTPSSDPRQIWDVYHVDADGKLVSIIPSETTRGLARRRLRH